MTYHQDRKLVALASGKNPGESNSSRISLQEGLILLSDENFIVRPLPTIVFERGSSHKLSDQIQSLGLTSALIVTDKNLADSGVLDPVLDALRAANLKVEVFDGVEPNPTDLNVEAGAQKLRDLGDACVVPIGGGSSMDCGKSIALLAANGGTVEELQTSSPKEAKAPVIAVPTTAGTGSETNSACVITNTRLGRKTYVMHPSITPAFAVLDADLTVGLPTYPTATCGFDVLTHAVEAFVSAGASAYSDAIALEAIAKVADNLRDVVKDGSNIEARSQMLLGSAMAAIAFNVSGLGSVHGTGHAISARLNAAHGQTLATMLPHVMDYNMSEREDKYIEVAKLLAPSGPATGTAAIDAVLQIRSDIGIDRSISDLGGDDNLLEVLVEDAVADPVNFSNPRPVDANSIRKLYEAAW
ncbi:MAG: methanol dehydrogenase [Gammaproteobacteria bacterium]|nr:methanol dehydrogenase [Gammaproteobacteria bacterium]